MCIVLCLSQVGHSAAADRQRVVSVSAVPEPSTRSVTQSVGSTINLYVLCFFCWIFSYRSFSLEGKSNRMCFLQLIHELLYAVLPSATLSE